MDALREIFFGTAPIRTFQQFVGTGWDLPFRVFSLLGDVWGMVLVAGVAFWLYGRRPAYAVIGVVALGAALWLVVVGLFDVERPSGAGIVVYDELDAGAFPSGHVFQAVSAWGILYALRCVPLAVPIAAAILVAIGRFYLGAHFLADVLAGMAMAALWVWLFARSWPTARDFIFRHRRLGWILAGCGLLAAGYAWHTAAGMGHLRRWEVAGLALGVVIAIPLERRRASWDPDRAGISRAALLAAGLAGLAILYAAGRITAPLTPIAAMAAAALGVIWVFAGLPAVLPAPAGHARDDPSGN